MIYISKLWKFVQGYVIISIKGYNIEKLINKAVQLNINIYNIEKLNNTAKLTICPKDFKAFIKLSKKYKCKTKILNKNGLFRFILFFRYNFLYLLGILIAIILVYFLTQRIWIIDIKGNTDISKSSILYSCNTDGLYVGCSKNNIDCKKIAENIKLKYKTISWINISLKGASVHIKLSEEKPYTIATIKSEPMNIVATTDCQIASIVTTKGTPQVKKNDIVKAGDILISAQLVPSGNEENPVNDIVNANGTVRGIINRTYAFTVPFNTKEKKYTGNRKAQYSFKVFNKQINNNKAVPFSQCDTSVKVTQLNIGESCPLPIYIYKTVYKEYILSDINRDLTLAKKIANKQIVDYIVQNYAIDSDIISVNTKYNKSKNALQVSSEIVSNENVGKEMIYEEIGGNTLNGTKENSNIS